MTATWAEEAAAGTSEPLRRVLIVAYYFPPMGLSGVQRVAKFARYLPLFGWQPTVLTVKPGGYFAYDDALLDETLRAGVQVDRTGSIDPTRLFRRGATVSLPKEGSRQLLSAVSQFCFQPDNKIGWYPAAVARGSERLKEGFDLVFSSAPPYSGHLIAATLARRHGLPLVVDYRDAWVRNPRHVYPTRVHRWVNEAMERSVHRTASHVTAINETIAAGLGMPTDAPPPPVTVLPQGFDEADFNVAPQRFSGEKMTLCYSGVFYDAQTPDVFLKALARQRAERPDVRTRVRAVFVGLVPEASRALAARLELGDDVEYAGYLPHEQVPSYLKGSDVLWMTIGERAGAEGISTGKLYEYMGARKPILALVPEGEAARTLRAYEAAEIVHPDDEKGTADALSRLFDQWKSGRLPKPREAAVAPFERKLLAEKLASIFQDTLRVSRLAS